MTEDVRLRHFDFGEPIVAVVSPPTADELGRTVRELYCHLHRAANPRNPNYGREPIPAWDGGRDNWGTNHKSIWPRIAAMLLHRQFDPATYLQVQFQETNGRKSPLPSMLLSQDAIDRYQSYMGRAHEILRQEYERAAIHLQRRLLFMVNARGTPEEKMITALMDEGTVQACVLFRYCMACKLNIVPAMERYHASALRQYMFQAALYDHAWGIDVIPDHLRQEARTLRAAH